MSRWADNITAILPERLLHAYVDVLLPIAKRRAVQRALMRQPELRETVEAWRKQNADFRRLALLETPGPMPLAMAGVTHRLERRLRRFAPLEGLRIAAVVALLLSGVAGMALVTQVQLDGGKTLVSFAPKDDRKNQSLTKPIPANSARAEAPVPAATVETVVVTVDAPPDVHEPPSDTGATERPQRSKQVEPAETPENLPETTTPPITAEPEAAPSIAETPKPDEPPRNI